MRREPRAKPTVPAVRPVPPASLGDQLVALLTAFLDGQREMSRKLDLLLADLRDDAPTVH